MRRSALLISALAGAALVAACASPAAPPASSPAAESSAPASEAPGAASVSIVEFKFEPAALSVKVGDTVTWTNDGHTAHSVKWSDGEPESEHLEPGKTYARTFDRAGEYPYVCGIHATMTGTITVTE
jgi:plastocyanin